LPVNLSVSLKQTVSQKIFGPDEFEQAEKANRNNIAANGMKSILMIKGFADDKNNHCVLPLTIFFSLQTTTLIAYLRRWLHYDS
jgi:hypothetical protein